MRNRGRKEMEHSQRRTGAQVLISAELWFFFSFFIFSPRETRMWNRQGEFYISSQRRVIGVTGATETTGACVPFSQHQEYPPFSSQCTHGFLELCSVRVKERNFEGCEKEKNTLKSCLSGIIKNTDRERLLTWHKQISKGVFLWCHKPISRWKGKRKQVSKKYP